jgi:hypothetical protein
MHEKFINQEKSIKEMIIIIGRDAKTSQLRISIDGKTTVVGVKEEVPSGVSREHISINVDDEGQFTLENLNIGNDTYVNGMLVERKRIKKEDYIELGKEHYLLNWHDIDSFIPKYVNIRNLEKIWNDYQEQLLQLQIKERRSGVLRSATGLITMAAMLLSIFTGRDNPLFLLLYAMAGIVSAAFFIKAYLDSAKMPRLQQEIRDGFPKQYVCPSCGQFLGNQSYDIISKRTSCPYCKVKYKV